MDIVKRVMPTHIVAVAGIVENENAEILLVNTHKNGWVFPGGQVEVGENLIEALKREIKEEAGIEIKIGEVFCISSNVATHKGYGGVDVVPTKVMLDFKCTYLSGSLSISEENSETAWFSKDEALSKINTPSNLERFNAFLNYSGRPTYLAYKTKPNFDLKEKTLF